MFRVGQKVVCIGYRIINPDFNGIIKKGDVVTVERFITHEHMLVEEDHTINRFGIRASYPIKYFRPIVGDAKADLIEKFIEVVETSDCPIQMPQNV